MDRYFSVNVLGGNLSKWTNPRVVFGYWCVIQDEGQRTASRNLAIRNWKSLQIKCQRWTCESGRI